MKTIFFTDLRSFATSWAIGKFNISVTLCALWTALMANLACYAQLIG